MRRGGREREREGGKREGGKGQAEIPGSYLLRKLYCFCEAVGRQAKLEAVGPPTVGPPNSSWKPQPLACALELARGLCQGAAPWSVPLSLLGVRARGILLQPCNHPGLRSGQNFVGTPGPGRKEKDTTDSANLRACKVHHQGGQLGAGPGS